MSLTNDYLVALRDYLQDRYETIPPPLAVVGEIKVGALQADPVLKPAVITLHVSDPFDETAKHIELITEQRRSGGGSSHALFGGYAEMGDDGKGSSYWYYWWIKVEYYMNRSGLNQERAAENNADLVRWLRQQLADATPRNIGLVQDEEAVLLQTKVCEVTTREHGGPPASYIWSSLLKIKGLVFGD